MDRQRLEDVDRARGIELVVQFGSSVSGLMHKDSDIDLGVLLARVPESLAEYADLLADLPALVPDRHVHVAMLNHADPLFLKRILEECRLLYGSAERLHLLELYAFKRYQDHRRFLQMEGAYVDRMIAALGR